MKTRSQTKRLSEIENKIRQEIRDMRPMTYGEKLLSDFKIYTIKINNECLETHNKIERVKLIKQLYERIDAEIELLWPTMLRQNVTGIKQLLLVFYNKARYLQYEIENLQITMKDHQLLVDTCSLLQRVFIKIEPKVIYICELCATSL